MPTTSQTRTEETTSTMQDAVRNWDLDGSSAMAVMAFPFTSRRLPRASKRTGA